MSAKGHRNIFASDIEWHEGGSGTIKYTRFRTDEANTSSPMIVVTKFAAGAVVGPHTHDSNYFEYVIEGEQTVGTVTFSAGDVRLVRGNTGYGPITIGRQGCTVLIVFENATGAANVPLPRKRPAQAIAS